MSVAERASVEDLRDLARESLYRFLAAVVGGPYAGAWSQALDPASQGLALESAELLREAGDLEGVAFADLAEQLGAPADRLRADFDRTFGLVTPRECPPYEAEYYPTSEPFARAQLMADVAGFYRAFGLEPSRRAPERPDHLALELEFLAYTLMMGRRAGPDPDDVDSIERASLCAAAHRDFFRDHVAWWVPSFADGLRRRAERGYLESLARALAAWVPAECGHLGIPAILRPARPGLIETPDEQSGCATCPLNV